MRHIAHRLYVNGLPPNLFHQTRPVVNDHATSSA
jgi:hypothetical protein